MKKRLEECRPPEEEKSQNATVSKKDRSIRKQKSLSLLALRKFDLQSHTFRSSTQANGIARETADGTL